MDYAFGRLAIWLLKGMFWIALIGGVLIAFGGVGGSLYYTARQEFGIGLPASFFSSLAGVVIVIFAMIALAFLDHIAATIDTAVWTKKGVRVSEQQLAISKEALRVNKQTLAIHSPSVVSSPDDDERGERRGLLGMFGRGKPSRQPATSIPKQEPVLSGNGAAAAEIIVADGGKPEPSNALGSDPSLDTKLPPAREEVAAERSSIPSPSANS